MASGPRTPEAGYGWVSIPEAQEKILAETTALEPEQIQLAKSAGSTLAIDVVAGEPLPPFPASIKVGSASPASDAIAR